jgi:hypothetical protein
MSWHTQSIRPITRADVGKFVVGFGVAGRVCGYIERMHGDYLVIDTGRNSGPMGGNIPIDVITRYTFIEVPQWAEDSLQQVAM